MYLWDTVRHTLYTAERHPPPLRTTRRCSCGHTSRQSPRNYLLADGRKAELDLEFRKKNGLVDLLPEDGHRERVLTWAGLDTGRPEGELGVGVVHHLVGFRVVDSQWRTGVLTGAIVIKVPTGLDRKQRRYGLLSS